MGAQPWGYRRCGMKSPPAPGSAVSASPTQSPRPASARRTAASAAAQQRRGQRSPTTPPRSTGRRPPGIAHFQMGDGAGGQGQGDRAGGPGWRRQGRRQKEEPHGRKAGGMAARASTRHAHEGMRDQRNSLARERAPPPHMRSAGRTTREVGGVTQHGNSLQCALSIGEDIRRRAWSTRRVLASCRWDGRLCERCYGLQPVRPRSRWPQDMAPAPRPALRA